MSELQMNIPPNEHPPFEDDPLQTAAQTIPARQNGKTLTGIRLKALILFVVYAFGLASGYLVWGRPAANLSASPDDSGVAAAPESPIVEPTSATPEPALTPVAQSIRPLLPTDYTLPVSFSDIGPQLLAAGAIDYDRFVQLYEQRGRSLTKEQLNILTEGSDEPIVMNGENAHFLLNFFWAFGLTNQNALLEEGPMMKYGAGDIGRFASTGGWTIGRKPATELYASMPIVTLTPAQQARLEEVAAAVYRPCCNNPTAFPDCNHGMAMLGVLELLASQDVTTEEMFEAAKYLNAFWFPQQTYELALAFDQDQGLDFADIDARELVSSNFSSSSGFQAVHQWLADNNLLPQAPGGGNSCGV